jgi:hypothetical protein
LPDVSWNVYDQIGRRPWKLKKRKLHCDYRCREPVKEFTNIPQMYRIRDMVPSLEDVLEGILLEKGTQARKECGGLLGSPKSNCAMVCAS